MGKQRPKYPDEYYQYLRKEVNFGCAKCGKPLVRFHHIEGYEDGILEKPERLIALCKKDHEIADKVLMKINKQEKLNDKESGFTKEKLYDLKKNPFNKNKVNHGFSIKSEKEMKVHIGSNTFTETPEILRIHGETIISIKRDHDQILFSAKFYDKSDELRLNILDNFWEADTELFDVWYSEEASSTFQLSIKTNNTEPYLNLKIVNDGIHITGKFYCRGQLFDVREDGVFFMEQQLLTMTGCTFHRVGVGIDIS